MYTSKKTELQARVQKYRHRANIDVYKQLDIITD